MSFSITLDTGGTFTDLVLADEHTIRGLHKAPTTPHDPYEGILSALDLTARAEGLDVATLLERTETIVYATTHATNAILEGRVARTAFLTTEGHRDILLYREGGKQSPFNLAQPYPDPYVPRSLSFELPERIVSDGSVVQPLDERATLRVIERLRALEVEAVGVCLLWSIANPTHEKRVGELLASSLPGIPFSLSCELNPNIREYRRASSTVIDASLKPLMRSHLQTLDQRLRALGFRYGDFDAHNGLWEMAERTSGDVLARMALVPRTLEARGLDASPAVRAKLSGVGDTESARVIDIILRDEIGHVAIGNRWFRFICGERGVDPREADIELAARYAAPRLRGPFNLEARRAAGFDDEELRALGT